MKTTKARIVMALIVGALVVALAVPAGAGAFPAKAYSAARGAALAAGSAGGQLGGQIAARLELLRARIVAVLQTRKARFDAVSTRIDNRIGLVSSLADKVQGAGGNVSGTRSMLDTARQHLSQARTLESQCEQQFQAVVGATDKVAAFQAARATGRQAAEELRQARIALIQSAQQLRQTVQQLKAQGAGGGNGQ